MEDGKWKKGPEGIYHKPMCFYRKGGFKDALLCDCYRIMPTAMTRERAAARKPIGEDEVPF